MQRISVVFFAVETQHCSPCNSKFSSFHFGAQSVSLHPLLSFYRLYLNGVFWSVPTLWQQIFNLHSFTWCRGGVSTAC